AARSLWTARRGKEPPSPWSCPTWLAEARSVIVARMGYPIAEVAVLGSGVMGAAIAAHLANAGVKVLLLDVPPKDAPLGDRRARNAVAQAGLDKARKARPAAFFSPRFDTLVRVGNLEDDLEAAAKC